MGVRRLQLFTSMVIYLDAIATPPLPALRSTAATATILIAHTGVAVPLLLKATTEAVSTHWHCLP